MNVHQTIIKGVKEQLFFNNYLVLPNFGGFILKKTPSHFSASGGMLIPPSKTISFNGQLKQNDGILAQWLQVTLECNNNQAIAHLHDFSEYCKSILKNKGRLTIDGLGFFYSDFENNVCFEPQQQINFLTSSFGLGPVSVKEIEIETMRNTETIFADRLIVQKKLDGDQTITGTERKTQKNYRRSTTIAISGIFLFLIILFVISNSKLNGRLKASLFGEEQKLFYSPIAYQELNLKDLNTEKKDYIVDVNGIATLDLENNKTLAVRALDGISINSDLNIKAKPLNEISASRKNFKIVLGCFSILNNAKRMIKKLKEESVNANISGQNNKGLYIVSSGAYISKEEALVQLSQIKNTCPNAWIKSGE